MRPKDADGMANSVGPDKTVPFRSSLIWAFTVCSGLSVPILIVFTVSLIADAQSFPFLRFLLSNLPVSKQTHSGAQVRSLSRRCEGGMGCSAYSSLYTGSVSVSRLLMPSSCCNLVCSHIIALSWRGQHYSLFFSAFKLSWNESAHLMLYSFKNTQLD